jgi:hypothetical protein
MFICGNLASLLPKQATTLERDEPKWKAVLLLIFGQPALF